MRVRVRVDNCEASKVGELGRRWTSLQNMMMAIQDKLERKDETRDRMEDILVWSGRRGRRWRVSPWERPSLTSCRVTRWTTV